MGNGILTGENFENPAISTIDLYGLSVSMVYNMNCESSLQDSRLRTRDSIWSTFPGREDLMMKDLVLQLRYLGVIPQIGYREYGFRVEDKDKSFRQIVLTIDDALFLQHRLMFQEAPDLCYQKVLMNLSNESAQSPICSRISVTESDIAFYRDAHPTARARNKPGMRRSA